MAFWNEAALEPKRKFKFLIRFGNASLALPSFIAKKCDKPSFDITETKHDFLGHAYYYPGRVNWKEVTATVIDPAGSGGRGDTATETLTAASTDVASAAYQVLIAAGYQSPVNAATAIGGTASGASLRTMSKGAATTQFDQIEIVQVNQFGAPLETWVLNNAWIKSVNFGNLDYSSDEISEITFTFRYDWADIRTTVYDSTTLTAASP